MAPALFGSKNSKQEEAFDKLEKAIDGLQKNMADVIMNTIELQRQLTNNNEQVLSAVRSSPALRVCSFFLLKYSTDQATICFCGFLFQLYGSHYICT